MLTGIIGAMQEEIAPVKAALDVTATRTLAGIEYYSGALGGRDVILACGGIGKVNAAVCAQIMINVFAVDRILFTGVAGGIAPDLAIGDIVISTDTAYYDMDVSALGYELGMIPRLQLRFFPADPELVSRCRAAADHLPPHARPDNIVTGRILTGDSFIADPDQALRLRRALAGHCLDMESAAVAHVCTLNNIPFVIIRSLSDRADTRADVDYRASIRLAAANAAALTLAAVRSL